MFQTVNLVNPKMHDNKIRMRNIFSVFLSLDSPKAFKLMFACVSFLGSSYSFKLLDSTAKLCVQWMRGEQLWRQMWRQVPSFRYRKENTDFGGRPWGRSKGLEQCHPSLKDN